jgi:hypothetical protein
MRRSLRRSLLTIAMCVVAGAASAHVARDPGIATNAYKLVVAKKLTPKERAEAARQKAEAQRAKEMHQWVLGRDGSRPSLSFARMNGDDPRVSLTCQDLGLVRVIVYDVPAKGMRPGDSGRVRLSNGPARVEVAATALPNEKNQRAVDLGGITKVSPRLFSLIKSGDTMVVEVPGRTTGVALKTMGAKAEAFERSCLGGGKR